MALKMTSLAAQKSTEP